MQPSRGGRSRSSGRPLRNSRACHGSRQTAEDGNAALVTAHHRAVVATWHVIVRAVGGHSAQLTCAEVVTNTLRWVSYALSQRCAAFGKCQVALSTTARGI